MCRHPVEPATRTNLFPEIRAKRSLFYGLFVVGMEYWDAPHVVLPFVGHLLNDMWSSGYGAGRQTSRLHWHTIALICCFGLNRPPPSDWPSLVATTKRHFKRLLAGLIVSAHTLQPLQSLSEVVMVGIMANMCLAFDQLLGVKEGIAQSKKIFQRDGVL